jgi:hypothetical protein
MRVVESRILTALCVLVAPLVLPVLGCSKAGGSDDFTDGGDDSSAETGPGSSACPPCVSTSDCSGGVCAQFGGDIYCAPSCNQPSDCTPDRACTAVTDFSGAQVSVCVPIGDVCGSTPGGDSGPPSDATPTDSGSPEHCGTLVGPDIPAGCTCSTGHTCAANGCYGGWWCDTSTKKCHAPPAPSTCGGTDAGPPPPFDAGPPPVGTVGPSGGTLSRLYFAVVGDTRPATDDDTAGYPTTVINQIYGDIAATSPLPSFAVSTGDYMFAKAFGTQSGPQLDLYLAARGKYSGTEFPAMGNHECTGAVDSNCGPSGTDGLTANYKSFQAKMLAPIGQTNPYYSIRIDATDGSWTSKFVFIAANAWDATQSAWLDSAMAVSTTYTFVVRHEPAEATTAPGVTPSEAIIGKYPFTLKIVGHTHLYEHKSYAKEVVIGNGGAPLTGTGNFGYGIFSQRGDGAIVVDMYDYSSRAPDGAFHFAVKADGSAAAP